MDNILGDLVTLPVMVKFGLIPSDKKGVNEKFRLFTCPASSLYGCIIPSAY